MASTLLTKPAFEGAHPDGGLEWSALAVGAPGLAVLVYCSVMVLRSRELAFNVDADELYRAAQEADLLRDAEAFDLALAHACRAQRAKNEPTVRVLCDAFNAGLAGLVVEVVGLALAAALAG